uniref:Transposase n=1 Tax=Steinernema glaseri TaxID=37863 RepID=A0A1I8ATS9_9BILA
MRRVVRTVSHRFDEEQRDLIHVVHALFKVDVDSDHMCQMVTPRDGSR